MYEVHFFLPFQRIKSASGRQGIINAVCQQAAKFTADGIFFQFLQVRSFRHIRQAIQVFIQIFFYHVFCCCHQCIRKTSCIFDFQSVNLF